MNWNQAKSLVNHTILPSSVWWKDYIQVRAKVGNGGFWCCETSPSFNRQALNYYTQCAFKRIFFQHFHNKDASKKNHQINQQVICLLLYIFCYGPEGINSLWFTLSITDYTPDYTVWLESGTKLVQQIDKTYKQITITSLENF